MSIGFLRPGTTQFLSWSAEGSLLYKHISSGRVNANSHAVLLVTPITIQNGRLALFSRLRHGAIPPS